MATTKTRWTRAKAWVQAHNRTLIFVVVVVVVILAATMTVGA